MTKAHKVLGSTFISIDSAKSWEGTSNSGLSVSVSESTAPTSRSSAARTTERDRRPHVNHGHTHMHAHAHAHTHVADWDDESAVLPQRIKIDEPADDSDDNYTDPSRALREQPSTSTIKSWYDKSKQPLSVTQQTSASAMAKGLPPKAQRLLDVDNNHQGSKNKKKPSKLDLSRLKVSSQPGKDWEGPVLGNGYVNRSPSMVSPKTPNSAAKYRQRLQKRPTKENLQRQQVEVIPQQHSPNSGERVSPRCPPDMTKLPSLYKHYEQTSFAMMDQDLDGAVGEEQHPDALLSQPVERSARNYNANANQRREPAPAPAHQPWPQRTPDEQASPLRNHPATPVLGPSPQVVHVPTAVKHEQLSPTDCSASISSRHTRTSKASKHTEKSFQTADFIDKSVLMLSSDSEDDDDGRGYTELSAPRKRTPSSVYSRPTSDLFDSMSMDSSGVPSMSSGASPKVEDTSNRQSNRTIRRTSTTPIGYLAIPSRFSTTSTQATTPSVDSKDSPHWRTTFHSSSTPSVMSVASGSSRNTATSLQGAEGYAIEEARAVEVRAVQSPPRNQKREDSRARNSNLEHRQPDTGLRQSRSMPLQRQGSSASTAGMKKTTIPLSQDAMNFYMESRPQSGEVSASSEEHFMGLTRQEQMLITALRQRRESMRKAGNTKPDLKAVKGHQSQESEATITEESLNFSFPIPPKSKHTPQRSSSAFPSMITIPGPKGGVEGSDKSITADGTMFLLSPPPPSHLKSPKDAPKHAGRQGARMSDQEQMLLYLDHPGGPALAIKEGMMSPDTEAFLTEGPSSFPRSGESISPPRYRKASLRRQRSNIETSAISGREFSPHRGRQGSAPIMEESAPPFPPPTRELPAPPTPRTPEQDEGVPRPDSPISNISSAFPSVPSKRRTQMARLSAFGPPKPSSASGWLDDN